jgi:hypothetical protein
MSSYLSVEDLNSITVFISSRYHDLRDFDSLDQTRTGTIHCSENTTVDSSREAFVSQEWNQAFRGTELVSRLLVSNECQCHEGCESICCFQIYPQSGLCILQSAYWKSKWSCWPFEFVAFCLHACFQVFEKSISVTWQLETVLFLWQNACFTISRHRTLFGMVHRELFLLIFFVAHNQITELHIDASLLFDFNCLCCHCSKCLFHTLVMDPDTCSVDSWISCLWVSKCHFLWGERLRKWVSLRHSRNTRNAIQNGLAVPNLACVG